MASFMFPLFMPAGVTIDVLVRVLVGITLFQTAYMAEVIRGGLQAVPKGQIEAAATLGLSYWQTQRKIVLPQALAMVVPGIMNSFIGIAEQQTTNLAVVAPGIAEALLATALGLVAAIPAVVIYNHFARAIAAHRAVVADSAAALLRVVSRDLSRGTLPEGKA